MALRSEAFFLEEDFLSQGRPRRRMAKSTKNQAAGGQVTNEGPPTPKGSGAASPRTPEGSGAASPRTSEGSGAASVEPMVLALAEQLGTFLGRVQAKADGWLENDALREQVGQIRDGAANLLKHVNSASAAARNAVMKPAAKKSKVKLAAGAAKGRSGGAVDAPGKRHRKPPPQESINKRMGEPRGKKAGQKQFSAGSRRGRG